MSKSGDALLFKIICRYFQSILNIWVKSHSDVSFRTSQKVAKRLYKSNSYHELHFSNEQPARGGGLVEPPGAGFSI